MKTIRNILGNKKGATAIEYGLIAALVSVAGVAALTAMGGSLRTMYETVSGLLNTASGGATP